MASAKPLYVTDARGTVIVAIHHVTPLTIARVIAMHPMHEQLIRGTLAREAPEVYNLLDKEGE